MIIICIAVLKHVRGSVCEILFLEVRSHLRFIKVYRSQLRSFFTFTNT